MLLPLTEHHAAFVGAPQSQAFDVSQGWVGLAAIGVGAVLLLVALIRQLRATLLDRWKETTVRAVVSRRFAQR